ncbi:hypothetical protein Kpol_1043p67 [Vanderwaltozyma polyspora DSM 70294]|uniref:Pantoate--beta-alanine ligase n=1 Tax=Vanderwaltozyma polyspora (strain ATCC 22028 / DSM 70294 / BCRC 21397 / CBS 2163 / NBRC 10782 / NRRL Y-8283 / UCD 57-17) TaxID=436907 RepID=A7TIT4_VANPO|nr:uncharacterized protein Kpol_1043p67 [Vanderwaltozyma polyspora DSM 70294]EDO17876.1 hypothetical protein Kpol_1043p67 [Vanderwaltozyma polyspora DSM 70294]
MKVLHTVKEVVEWRTKEIGDRRKISVGFVPTMGCLHQGHATLIKTSKQENDFTVVSIFVNPSQFAPTEDLDQYPRTLPEDIKLLESLGVDMLFAPTAKVMYPQGIPLDVTVQRGPFVSVLGVSEMLEGTTRPNFFRGVATVVTKLLNIVLPDIAYFGQKDIQQFTVLQVMVNELFMNTKLKMMPIVRGENGLALSSRNKYLSQESLEIATNIYKGLNEAKLQIESLNNDGGEIKSRDELVQLVLNKWKPFIDLNDFKVDYISIANWGTLTEVTEVKAPKDGFQYIISCAVYVTDRVDKSRKVRLIDNIVL